MNETPSIAPPCPINGLTDGFYIYDLKDRLDKTARWFQKLWFPIWSSFIYYSYHWLAMPFPKRVEERGAISQGDARLIAQAVTERLARAGFIHAFAANEAAILVRAVVQEHGSKGVEWVEGLMIAVDEERAREMASSGPRRAYDQLPIGVSLPNETCFYKCASKSNVKGARTLRDKVLPRVDVVPHADMLKLGRIIMDMHQQEKKSTV